MERLCERPGCSDRASVAYGMRPEDLVFWLDVLREHSDQAGGVLCRRHADSMVMPRGWTLDDLRDPDLHLFRPPPPAPRPRLVRPQRARTGDATGEQLRLDATVLAAADADADADDRSEGDAGSGPWTPAFDEADDLGGLLSAQSPLLSRAFRTADRPEP